MCVEGGKRLLRTDRKKEKFFCLELELVCKLEVGISHCIDSSIDLYEAKSTNLQRRSSSSFSKLVPPSSLKNVVNDSSRSRGEFDPRMGQSHWIT